MLQVFLIVLVLCFAMSLFYMIGAKAHARPGYFLILAFVSVGVGYLLDVSAGIADQIRIDVPEFNEINDAYFHAARFGSVVFGALAGALLGAAVANRAQAAHAERLRSLERRLEFKGDMEKRLSEVLSKANAKANSADPGDAALGSHSQNWAVSALFALIDEQLRLERELEELRGYPTDDRWEQRKKRSSSAS